MVQKILGSNTKAQKTKNPLLFGLIEVDTVRKDLNPRFNYNSHSIILFTISIFVFATSLSTVPVQGLDWFLLFVTFDLFIAGFVVKPIRYYKNGIDIATSRDMSALIYNWDTGFSEVKDFTKLFIPRVILYGILASLTLDFYTEKNFTILTVVYLAPWIIVIFTLLFMILVSFILIGIAMTIDDYYNKGSTHKAVQNIRSSISNSALELDKVIANVKRINDPRLSEDNRRRIADVLYRVRNYLVIDQDDPSFTPEMKVRFVQTEKDLAQNLLDNLKNDNCVVCYTPLKNSNGPFLACPVCGHGGHKEHIEEWFKTKTVCPSCSSDVSSGKFLIL